MAGNLIVLRRRIKSVKNTQKLTKAMKTVAAAKLRRATGELKRSKPYREKITFLLNEAGSMAEPAGESPKETDAAVRPLLAGNDRGAALLVVVASDKGLCGAFNSHVLRQGEARYRELAAGGREALLVTIGTKAARYFTKRGIEPLRSYNGLIGRLHAADAARIADELRGLFVDRGLSRVEFAFSEFVSASKQQFSLRQLLPVELEVSERTREAVEEAGTIFEPGADELFRALLPSFIRASVHHILLQSMAAEQVARMVAMDLATRNASDMIRHLTLQLNKMRQAAITKELLEIITATEALNK
jgi:F-type H+-transporting ATPase subunit gamma